MDNRQVTAEWIAQQRAVCDAATPGPWSRSDYASVLAFTDYEICQCVSDNDMEFITAARTALPAALDALEATMQREAEKEATIIRLTAERDAAVEKAREANGIKRGTMHRLGLYELLMKRLETDGYLRKELCNVDEDDCPSEKEQGYREAEYCEGCERFRHDYQANTDAPTGAESEEAK